MALEFFLLIWLKALPGSTIFYSPKPYPSAAACERAAAKVRQHYSLAFDPHHEYSVGPVVDTLCL